MSDGIDNLTLDVPLFIRLLEWAREENLEDADLHAATERMLQLNQSVVILGMANYDNIVNDTAATYSRLQAMLETSEMRWNPRTLKMRLVDPKKSRLAKKSHRKFVGRPLTAIRKGRISKGVKKADRTHRNRFGKRTRD